MGHCTALHSSINSNHCSGGTVAQVALLARTLCGKGPSCTCPAHQQPRMCSSATSASDMVHNALQHNLQCMVQPRMRRGTIFSAKHGAARTAGPTHFVSFSIGLGKGQVVGACNLQGLCIF